VGLLGRLDPIKAVHSGGSRQQLEVAERAGHSVEVLLRVYAKCIDGGEEIANGRIDAVLAS
jgi:hypothetical protein